MVDKYVILRIWVVEMRKNSDQFCPFIEDEFKPPKSDAEGSDDSASSGVEEKESSDESESDEYSDIAESPEKVSLICVF